MARLPGILRDLRDHDGWNRNFHAGKDFDARAARREASQPQANKYIIYVEYHSDKARKQVELTLSRPCLLIASHHQ